MSKIYFILFALTLLFTKNTYCQQNCNIDNDIPKYLLLGKFNPAKEKGFVAISSKYTKKQGLYAKKEVYEAFIAMHDSAAKDGIELSIVSATRSFNIQKYVWESKWNGKAAVDGKILSAEYSDPEERATKILHFSSMPGTSRHHWGTDFDFNNSNPAYYKTEKGKKILDWLEKNASYFGFYRPYTDFGENRKTGYQPEEWHWSYIASASLFLKAYKEKITNADLVGFDGDETIFRLKIIDNYVFGIDKKFLTEK